MDSTEIFNVVGSKNPSLHFNDKKINIANTPGPIILDDLICWITFDRSTVSVSGLTAQEKLNIMRSSGYLSNQTIEEAKSAWETLHNKKLN